MQCRKNNTQLDRAACRWPVRTSPMTEATTAVVPLNSVSILESVGCWLLLLLLLLVAVVGGGVGLRSPPKESTMRATFPHSRMPICSFTTNKSDSISGNIVCRVAKASPLSAGPTHFSLLAQGQGLLCTHGAKLPLAELREQRRQSANKPI